MLRKLAITVVALAFGLTVVFAKSHPVVFHTTRFAKSDLQTCGDYNAMTVGYVLFNSLREREPERVSEAFLAHWANGECVESLSPEVCQSVLRRTLPSNAWRLRYRVNSKDTVTMFFRSGCASRNYCRGGGRNSGKLIMESVLETRAATILDFVGRLRGKLMVAMEEGISTGCIAC
jgi:hypothetical protein